MAHKAAHTSSLMASPTCGVTHLDHHGKITSLNSSGAIHWFDSDSPSSCKGKSIYEAVPKSHPFYKTLKHILESKSEESVNQFKVQKTTFCVYGICSEWGVILVSTPGPDPDTKPEVLSSSTRILDKLNSLVVICNENGRVIYANQASKKITGFAPEELLGNGWWDKLFSTPQDQKKIKELIIGYIRKDFSGQISPVEHMFRDRNNNSRWILVQVNSINHESVVILAQDITKRKNVEQALIRAEQKAKAAAHELETFMYKASHDLRAPILTTKGILNIADRSKPEDVSNQYLPLLHKSINTMNRILDKLLHVIHLKQKKLITEKLDLKRLMDESIALLSDNGVKIKVQLDQVRYMSSDKELVRAIINNLLENAITFSKLSSPDPVVQVNINRVDHHSVLFNFCDSGEGISEREQRKIYDIFHRSSNRSTGPGIGLYIVKNAVNKLDGHIEMRSQKNKGTAFYIKIPDAGKQPDHSRE